jgi:hypothetical protein
MNFVRRALRVVRRWLARLRKRVARFALRTGWIASLYRRSAAARRFRAYIHRPDPFGVLWARPEDLIYVSGRTDAHTRRRAEIGTIIDGDWDLQRDRFEATYFYRWISQRYGLGLAWEDTDYFRRKLAQREAAGPAARTDEEMRARMSYWDSLFQSMKTSGYRLQSEIRPEEDLLTSLVNEICVDIGREGHLMVVDSRHRLAMAQVLGLDRIAVTVIARHPGWMALRDAILSGGAEAMLAGRYRQHPDITPRSRD